MKRSLLAIAILIPALGAAESIPIETGLSGNVVLELLSLAGPELPSSPKKLPLSAPEAGFWRVIARAPGSAPAAFDFLLLIEPAALPPLRLVPARRIDVRITDSSGHILGKVGLRVDTDFGEGSWNPVPVEAWTDNAGSARLEVAPSVPLQLTVTAPGFISERIEVAPQVTREILVSLKPGVARTLEIKDHQGKPVPEVTVTTAAGLRLGTTDKDGHLAVTVPRDQETELRFIAPDCRWLRTAVQRNAPAVVALSLEAPRTAQGRIVDRATKQPIAGAWVWPEGLPSCSARTDRDGRYSLALPGFGEPRVRAAAAAHRPESAALGTGDILLAPVEVRTASGRVVDLQGKPIPGAEVFLIPSSSSETVLKASTDAEGQFQIGRLGTGSFDLQAHARGYLLTRVRQVAIPPGKGNADLGVIALQRGMAFEGRVIDPEGNPIAGARVEAAPTSGLSPGDLPADGKEALTGGDGAFSLRGFREGEILSLRVIRRGFAPRTISGIETPLPEPLTVELTPAARIAGTVLDEAGDPVAGAKLVLTEEVSKDSKTPVRGRFVAVAEVDSAGRFEMVDLTPGRFQLSALASGYLPETRGGIDLKEGNGMDGIDLVLRRGAVIEGRVLAPDGSPVAGARVMVLDQPAQTDLGLAGRPETFADNEGRYQLGGISEGERTVAAEHAGFRPARRQVNVQEGTTPLDLRLGRGFEVSGLVTGPDGPVPGATLRLAGGESVTPVASGPDGAFRFEAVAEGRYRIQTETPGYAAADEEIRLAGASVTGLEIRLERGGAVSGRILGLPFQDLAQVQVVATAPDRPGQAGRVDYEGRYRVEGLGSGDWKVIATLPGQRRQAGGVVSLEDRGGEARLDLEFSAGFALSGRVERGGAPIAGALVLVASGDGSGGNTVTGPDGRFRVDGLRPGTYALTALETRSNLRSDQKLEIDGDREVVVVLPGD